MELFGGRGEWCLGMGVEPGFERLARRGLKGRIYGMCTIDKCSDMCKVVEADADACFRATRRASQPELRLLDPRHNADQRDDGGDDDGPQLNVQDVLVKGRRRRSGDGGEAERQQQVATDAVVLVQALCVCDATVQLWREEGREADEGLDGEEAVGDEAENAVGRVKVLAARLDLVVLYQHEAGDEQQDADVVEGGVGVGAGDLLLLRRCWLDDEDGLGDEQEAGLAWGG